MKRNLFGKILAIGLTCIAAGIKPICAGEFTDEIKRDVCGSVASGRDRWSKPTPESRSLVFSSAAGHRFEERKVEGGVIKKWINPEGRVVAYSLYSKNVTPASQCSP